MLTTLPLPGVWAGGVWAGGSGDLASNWITGYVENTGTLPGGIPTATFENWVTGAPVGSEVSFQIVLVVAGVDGATATDSAVASGGTLSGILNVGTVDMETPYSYVLTGDLTASTLLSFSTLTVHGPGAALDITNDLSISSALTITGAGSTLTDDGVLQLGAAGRLDVSNGADATIEGAVTGIGVDTEIENNGTLELGGAFAAGETVSFSGTGPGTLILDDPADFQGTITDLAVGDTIDLNNVPLDDSGYTVFDTNNVLQIFENGSSYSIRINLSQNLAVGFALSADSSGNGTDIALTSGPVAGGDAVGQTVPGSTASSQPVTGYSVSSSVNPYDGVVYIDNTTTSERGSGFIIGPHTILTAAHVVGNSQSLTGFIETADGSLIESGTFATTVNPSYFALGSSPGNSTDTPNDFAIIELPDITLTPQFSLLGNYAGGTVNITGFPASLPGFVPSTPAQFNDLGVVSTTTTQGELEEESAVSYSGESGGPIWVDNGGLAQAVGIVTGPSPYDLQLTSSDISLIESWENGIPCYCRGTRILTDRGEVAVENLRVGELVQTVLSKTTTPIIWMGLRYVDCTSHPDPKLVWPIRVAVDAFGPGRPHTDLYLSPDHAVYVNDVLIPIKHLINETTIVQVPSNVVAYYHIELDQHDVLLAEGMPAESYLDVGDRSNFANGDALMRLIPNFSTGAVDVTSLWEAKGCAPLIIHGPELKEARRIVTRARALLEWVATTSAPRRVEIDGAPFAPTSPVCRRKRRGRRAWGAGLAA